MIRTVFHNAIDYPIDVLTILTMLVHIWPLKKEQRKSWKSELLESKAISGGYTACCKTRSHVRTPPLSVHSLIPSRNAQHKAHFSTGVFRVLRDFSITGHRRTLCSQCNTQQKGSGFVNPAVSLVFFSFGELPPIKFIVFVIAQCLAAVCASVLVLIIYYDAIVHFDGGPQEFAFGNGTSAHLFAAFPADYLTLRGALVDQIIASALFIFLIVFISDPHHGIPELAQPHLFGVAFAAVATGIGINAGYPLNPADILSRIFIYVCVGYGPHVFEPLNGAWIWVPVVSPLVGALVGGWFYKLTIGTALKFRG
uniref:Aquaporin n=1 Tax=Steinernema glaseri TaxID=37863 RepID=A0A1I7YFB8_9BILA